MTNILNNDATSDQNPDVIGADETLDPTAPQQPAPKHVGLGTQSVASEPEAPVGSGITPP